MTGTTPRLQTDPAGIIDPRRDEHPVRNAVQIAVWVAIAIPALVQLWLLTSAIAGRIGYPYDLEWMEGGMLHHALRLQSGQPLYPEPSVDFIPYLYTPLYPALLAVLGEVFGLGYTLGRVLSVLSLIGIAAIAYASICAPRFRHVSKLPALAGATLALGLFAAVYPYVEGWYDLVRADTLFLFLITAGIAGAANWSSSGEGARGHGRVAVVATILAFSFFTKQTGILYVALGGLIVLFVAWRRLPTYIAVAGVIGLGGTLIANAATDGWFWIYIREIHSKHDFNMDRFWKSFGNILWHFRAMTIIVVVALAAVAATYARQPAEGYKRGIPRQAKPLLLWSAAFAVSTLAGAIGWGTEFAHFNAYMPAFLHGALAAGAAVPALAACAGIWYGKRPHAFAIPHAAGGAAALALALACWTSRWEPSKFIPTAADVAAGDKLVKRIREVQGNVWVPSHPWYAVLAGKQPFVHRMGIKDVTWRQTRTVARLDKMLAEHRFAAVFLDNRDLNTELPQLRAAYRPGLKLPHDEKPRLYTGAKIVPDSLWVPAIPAKPPEGARVVFDFEQSTWAGWTRSGPAWGEGPVSESRPGQDLVIGATGQRFATSMHGGDTATGRITSPSFALDGTKLTIHMGGGTDATKLRIELWVDGAIVQASGAPSLGGDVLREMSWDISAHRGKFATLVLVDDATTTLDAHLTVDDVWIWD
jgi:hypothetical protein